MKKKEIADIYYQQMFERAMMMFKYENLPDTIPEEHLEKYLLSSGECCIAKVNGDLYALKGSEGGVRDAYDQPTEYIVANPYLNLSKSFEIGKDCVLCCNTKTKYPISKIIRKSTDVLAENYISLNRVLFNGRIKFIPTAKDEDTFKSIEYFLDAMQEGDLIPIMDKAFIESLSVVDITQTAGDQMIPYIELQQYVKGTLLNELGINANYNMKREALSANEVGLNEDALLPFVENMLASRRKFVDEVNEMFDTEIKVDFASIWKSNVIERIARVNEINPDLQTEEVGGESTSGEVVLDEGDLDGKEDVEIAEDFSRLNPDEDVNEDVNEEHDNDEHVEEAVEEHVEEPVEEVEEKSEDKETLEEEVEDDSEGISEDEKPDKKH